MADESEITLMKSDIISEVLEKWYEEGSKDFLKLIESYSRLQIRSSRRGVGTVLI